MIDLIFYYGTEIIFVRVDNNNIKFATSTQQNVWSSIEGLKLSKAGVIKEFPDLKENDDWKSIAIKRFKEKIKSFDTEEEKCNYVVKDLEGYGYQLKKRQRVGFRKEVIK